MDTVKKINKKRDDRAWVEVRIRPFSRTVDHCSSYLLWFINHIKEIETNSAIIYFIIIFNILAKGSNSHNSLKLFSFSYLCLLAYSNLTRHCENLQQFLARFFVNKNLSLDLFLMQNYMTWEDLHIKGHISKISEWNKQTNKKICVNIVNSHE